MTTGDLEKYYVSDMNNATFYSYGLCKGKFNVSNQDLLKCVIEHPQILDDYCLVEKKKPKYMFMVDLDFKEKVEPFVNVNGKKFPGNGDVFVLYNTREDEITQYLINVISTIVNSKEYIYCDKWNMDNHKMQGVHLYFPTIEVDTKLHREIFDKVFKTVLKEKKYDFTEKVWRTILDASVASPNVSLRLPYFKLDGMFYRPNPDKSTYVVTTEMVENIKLVLN